MTELATLLQPAYFLTVTFICYRPTSEFYTFL